MKLISKNTNIKYKGERYYANVPFDLNVKSIPSELEDLVEEYKESGTETSKSKSSKKDDGLLIKEKKSSRKSKKKTPSNEPIAQEITLEELSASEFDLGI